METERSVRGRLDGPPRVASVLASAWLVSVAWAESDAGVPFPRWMVLAGVGVVLLGWWLLRFVIAAVVGRRNPGILFAHALAWAVIPTALVAAIVVGNTLVLLRARVWLSSRALVRAADEVVRRLLLSQIRCYASPASTSAAARCADRDE